MLPPRFQCPKIYLQRKEVEKFPTLTPVISCETLFCGPRDVYPVAFYQK
jgi:hypothetical protein